MLSSRFRLLWILLLCEAAAFGQTKAPGIQGPDGPQGIRPQKAPKSRPLREWLEERRQEREERESESGEEEKTETLTEKPSAKEQEKAKEKIPQVPLTAFFRWDLDLIYPKMISSQVKWSTEPGVRLGLYGQLIPSKENSASFWIGFRTLAFSGQGQIGQQTSRVAWTYFGPSLAWEWPHVSDPATDTEGGSSRQRVALGLALLSRQAEAELGDRPKELATRGLGFDGPGLWTEYTYAAQMANNCEWEFTSGLQLGAQKILLYLGMGFSLWLGEAP